MEHHSPSMMSPIGELDSPDNHLPRNRRLSVSGNRTWSDEEEAYLLRTRSQKMPYKHIAAHLKKTELACRLHYHQLSHGSHRRRRNSSVCSSASSRSSDQSPNNVTHLPFSAQTPNQQQHHHHPQQQQQQQQISNSAVSATYDSIKRANVNNSPDVSMLTPDESPRQRSPHRSSFQQARRPSVRYDPLSDSPVSATATHHQKMLLPRPSDKSPHLLQRSASETAISGLRINTADALLRPSARPPIPIPIVDVDRLRKIYEGRRHSFWAAIAADYGPDASPAQLEEFWRNGFQRYSQQQQHHRRHSSLVRPPTPNTSPEDNTDTVSAVDSTVRSRGGSLPSAFGQASVSASAARPAAPSTLTQAISASHSAACQSPSMSAVDRFYRGGSPTSYHMASAVSAPDRFPYILPTPTASSAGPSALCQTPTAWRSSSVSWGSSGLRHNSTSHPVSASPATASSTSTPLNSSTAGTPLSQAHHNLHHLAPPAQVHPHSNRQHQSQASQLPPKLPPPAALAAPRAGQAATAISSILNNVTTSQPEAQPAA